jgi:histidinol-phosphate aminotransferase
MYKLPKKLRGFTPYVPLTGDYPIRLDANESFLELPTEQIMRAVLDIDKVALNRYPDPYSSRCVNAFANLFGVDPRLVTAGNGSDELIGLICAGLLEKGGKVLTLTPDFTMYSFYAKLYELEVREVAKADNFEIIDLEVIDYIKANDIDCLFFSNPCNPTSVGLDSADVRGILTACPDTLIVVDEAYMDFWDESESLLGDVVSFANLIVLRTCSKSVALAGIRLGFAVANDEITEALHTVKSPFNVNSLTQAIGTAILSDKEGYRNAIALLKQNTAILREFLEKLDMFEEIYDTKANFVFCKVRKSQKIYEYLLTKGIAVRHFPGHLRICAGSGDEIKVLLKELQKCQKELKI